MSRPAIKFLAASGLIAASCDAVLAASVDHVALTIEPVIRMDARRLDDSHIRIRVASNSAFSIIADDVVGDVSVSLETSMGANAQIPGPVDACSTLIGQPGVIYSSQRRTAAAPGRPSTQAVSFIIEHDPMARPTVRAVRKRDAELNTCDSL